ncbi:MAG: shikimate dehydrogenase [Pseudomonadota bacterium]
MSEPDRYALIGHPVAHSRSPFIHDRFARQTGQSLVYSTLDAPPQHFAQVVREFFEIGGKGLNVTLPHKEAALALVAELTPRAARAGAVNTLALRADGCLLGDNTDGAGLARDLLNNHRVRIAGRRVLLLGAGGAARGALAPLLGLMPASLTLVNRTPARAADLAQQFADSGNVRAREFTTLGAKPYDIVINASSSSLAGEVPPLPPDCVDRQSFCYDMAYGREDTPFVRWAQQRGCARAVMGLGMLVEQAAESYLLWRGVRPDTASVLAELTAALHA